MSGTLRLRGSTSGYSELQAPAVAADQTFILPTAGGTLLTTDSPISKLTLELGSASQPSLTFEGDTDTGLYSSGTNTLNLVTGGNNRLNIDSAGNVGIGSGNLFIGGTDAATADIALNADGTATFVGRVRVGDYDNNNGANINVKGAITLKKTDSTDAQIVGQLSGTETFKVLSNGSAEFKDGSSIFAGVNGGSAVFYGGDSNTTSQSNSKFRINSNGSATFASDLTINSYSSGGVGNGLKLFSAGKININASGTKAIDIYDSGVGGSKITLNADGSATFADIVDSSKFFRSTRTASSGGELFFQGKVGSDTNCSIAANGSAYFSGNVGIGRTSPGEKLDILSTSGNCLIKMQAPVGSVSGFNAIGSNELAFQTGFSEKMRIDSSGRLLVGTSGARANFFHSIVSPHIQQEGNGDFDRQASITSSSSTSHFGASFILAHQKSGTIGGNTACANQDVSGLLSFQANDGTHFLEHARIQAFVDGNSGANDMPGGLQFYTATDGAQSVTERMLLRANGLLQVPSVYTSTTSSAANVSVNSTGFLQRSTSSAKYKTNIETLENSYSDALLNCRPVWYQSTCETDNSDWGWWGFIAEEVAKIDPRLVQWKTTEISHDEDGRIIEAPCDPEPEGVQYDRFVPHLLNLIKRQQTAIETLEAKVAALEAN